ncbi:MAG: hypothetical protein S4CHLAM45_12470 [Chlamydiales bacterium]|nr:hypothetical protein [Chlamydiales bacterium]MCH9619736.1 hypothetical protein [Chlamydiales bacterium]MCH9623342.1 hypothetical protein [Chlamydiales bacterium]
MGIIFVLLAGLFASISNYCMRRSIDAGGSSRAYLMIQLSFSFLIMILLNPLRMHDFGWSNTVVSLGLLGGLLLGAFMWGLGKSLEKGPPGLTLAIVNTSSVAPAIVLAVLFGLQFGHSYTLWNGVGTLLVVFGILWAGWTSVKTKSWKSWTFFSTYNFILHTLFLVYLQWWAMLLNTDLPLKKLLPFHIETTHIHWFMPAIFFMAAFFQWWVYLSTERRIPKRSEFLYGLLGGVTNGSCAFFLIKAPQVASSWQNAMLFPIYSVSIIVCCNLWSQAFYKEKVNWKANSLCMGGLVIGTVLWSSL